MKRKLNSLAITGLFAVTDFFGLLLVCCVSIWTHYAFGGQFGLLPVQIAHGSEGNYGELAEAVQRGTAP
jgi:hypothetical protein